MPLQPHASASPAMEGGQSFAVESLVSLQSYQQSLGQDRGDVGTGRHAIMAAVRHHQPDAYGGKGRRCVGVAKGGA